MSNKKSTSKRPGFGERVERIMMAVTFAEANAHDAALEMLTWKPEKRLGQRLQRRVESRKDRRPVLMA